MLSSSTIFCSYSYCSVLKQEWMQLMHWVHNLFIKAIHIINASSKFTIMNLCVGFVYPGFRDGQLGLALQIWSPQTLEMARSRESANSLKFGWRRAFCRRWRRIRLLSIYSILERSSGLLSSSSIFGSFSKAFSCELLNLSASSSMQSVLIKSCSSPYFGFHSLQLSSLFSPFFSVFTCSASS